MLPSKIVHSKAGRTLPFLLTALIFVGCSSQTPQTPLANVQNAATGTSDYYLQQMQQSEDDNKIDWQLLAIRALLNEGQLPQATDHLTQLPQELNNSQFLERRLLQAQLSIAQQNLPAATTLLQKIDPNTLSKDQQARYYQLQIASSQDRPSLDLLRAYIAQELLLTTPADKQKNIDATWQALTQITQAQMNSLTINADENVLQGWLDLLGVYNAHRNNPANLEASISDWQVRYPNNPAAKMLPTALSQMQNVQQTSGSNIALLLPLSGQAQILANAIQQGFNDAKNGVLVQNQSTAPEAETSDTADDPNTVATPLATSTDTVDPLTGVQPQSVPANNTETAPPSARVQVYDTNNQSIVQVLSQAQQEGATLIVGPLIKNNVEQLVNNPLSLNVLALNEPETIQNHPNICYFALSPEDETRDAAHHMWYQGKRVPLLLLPRSGLGERVKKAFAREWQKLGGGTVLLQQFGSTAELKQGINNGVGIRLSGTPIDVQPEQPQSVTIAGLTIPAPPADAQLNAASGSSVDSVYIVATPDELALIKPMIAMRISSRDNVELYASSRSHQAGAGPDYRLEMDGLQYSDIPLLSGANPELMQQAAKMFNHDYSLVRLYAMGIDAWTLANHFSEMRQLPGFQLQGYTGNLSATQDCVINRKLIWNQYRQGQIVPAS